MLHGVLRVSSKETPQCTIQTKFDNETMQQISRGTIKIALLQGEWGITNPVTISIYDSKPTFFNCCGEYRLDCQGEKSFQFIHKKDVQILWCVTER